MSREIINLLPSERLAAFRRAYFLRLVTTGIVLLALVVVVHGILLLPAYLHLSAEADAAEDALALTSAEGGDAEESAARLALLASDATRMEALAGKPHASTALRAVLAVPRAGITLVGLSYTPPAAGPESGTMTVRGAAATRDALRAYDLALAALPFVSSADLPIGAYAEESDIAFTITLTGTLMP